jgi:hypothetical protein
LLIATAGIVGTLTTPVGAVASAAQCWAFYTGFILNRLGVLTFDHGSLTTLLVIVLTGIMPSLLLTTARRLPNTRHSIRTLVIPVTVRTPSLMPIPDLLWERCRSPPRPRLGIPQDPSGDLFR